MSIISIKEIQEDAATVFHLIEAGEHFVVTMGGRPVAELHPIAKLPSARKRPYGLAAGQFIVPKDLDAPLPDEILHAAEKDDDAFLAEIQRRRNESLNDPACMIPANQIDWQS